MINYEITALRPEHMFMQVTYTKNDREFKKNFNLIDFTEENIHSVAKEHAVYAQAYWDRTDTVVAEEPSVLSGSVKSIVTIPPSPHDFSIEYAEKQIVEDETTITVSYIIKPLDAEVIANRVRGERDRALLSTDWMAVKAAETGVPLSQEWVDYRQSLRDITTVDGFPYVDLPTKPVLGE